MMTGTIRRVDPQGYGFVVGSDGLRRFFTATEVRDVPFDTLCVGTAVRFQPLHHVKGPRALNVRLV